MATIHPIPHDIQVGLDNHLFALNEMPALGDNLNVWNTCLAILRERGYELSLRADKPDADLTECFWVAEKDGYDLWASDPIQLLGLSAIHRYHGPSEPPERYWWKIEGSDIMDELIQARWPEENNGGEQVEAPDAE